MGTTISVLLTGQRNRAQDGNEDQDRGYFEGKQQIAEEHLAEVGGGDHVVSQPGLGQVGARGKKDERQQADEYGYSRNAHDVSRVAAMGALFLPGIEQHDDEGEQDHDGAGIDNYLGGGQKLRAQEKVQHGQRAHDHNQRESAVDRVALE